MNFSEILQLSEETKNESIAALEELNNQKDTLTHINNKVSNIDRILTKSNEVINTIRSITSNLINKIFGTVDNENDDDTNVLNQDQNIVFERVNKKPYQSPLYDSEDNACHSIVENNQYTGELDIILNTISDIKKIHITMGEELDEQNELLDTITENTENSNINLERTIKRVDEMT
jgi:CRISPR/Cas system-associated endonuclease/helicase Cas3